MPHLRRLRAPAFVVVAACALVVPLGPHPDATSAGPAPVSVGDVAPVTVTYDVPRRRPCRNGLVALTFDDGPRPGTTSALVRTLRRYDVPATFFQLGNRAAAHPRLVRLVDRAGFTIGNHSWDHPLLPRLESEQVGAQVTRTGRALRRDGVQPSTLMRPPYGGIDPRVRKVVKRLGLVPVLWTIDSEDWRGGDAGQIARGVLGALRPQARNVVLQHDGVRNSWASVNAVPQIVRRARAAGYCFAGLGRRGTPDAPVPKVVVSAGNGREQGRTAVRLLVRLTKPTVRPVRVRLRSVDGSATGGADYTPVSVTVRFAPGSTLTTVTVPVVNDRVDESGERFRVRLSTPRHATLSGRSVDVTIWDNDRPGDLRGRAAEPDPSDADPTPDAGPAPSPTLLYGPTLRPRPASESPHD